MDKGGAKAERGTPAPRGVVKPRNLNKSIKDYLKELVIHTCR